MSETNEDQGTIEDAAGDDAGKAEPETKDNRTDYMVLYAPVPEDEDHEPRYREAGYQLAHDGDQAIRMVREADTEHGAFIRRAAEERGVYLRAVAVRTWKRDPLPLKIKVTRAWE